MFDFLEELNFGQRLFAQNRWWLEIKKLHCGFYLVIKSGAIMPCPVLLVKQADNEAKYQEILFRKFKTKRRFGTTI